MPGATPIQEGSGCQSGASNIAEGRSQQIKTHTRRAIPNGVSKEEIRELLMHSCIYCGVPKAVDGFRSAGEALAELGLEP